MKCRRIAAMPPRRKAARLFTIIFGALSISTERADAFAWSPRAATAPQIIISRPPDFLHNRHNDCHHRQHRRAPQPLRLLSPQATVSVVEAAAKAQEGVVLADYAPAAASLFSNMKLPSAVLTAGMISLGFATRFPELPRDSLDKVYPKEMRRLCSKLERLHIVLGLISVTSELIVVLWAAVSVNNLTERNFAPSYSVWDLIHRECDLAWSAVNSHFILGIIGFFGMLWLRAYVMLLASKASDKLMAAAGTGTAAALCLMISIVNRGVESGGGNSIDRYGSSILDLFSHYAMLLIMAATNLESPGPLQTFAIVLEVTSLTLLFVVFLTESDGTFEDQLDDDSCPIDTYDILNDKEEVAKLSEEELEKLKTCLVLEDKEQRKKDDPCSIISLIEEEEEERRRKLDDVGDNFL